MKTRIGLEFEIDFSHVLKGHPKCGQLHGHTSKIQIELEGKMTKGNSYQENMIMDFSDMKKQCWKVISQLDHNDLNTMFAYPTSENIAEWIFTNLKKDLDISSVKFFEGNGKWCVIENI